MTVSYQGSPLAGTGAPKCDFSSAHDFDHCGTEAVPGATLFVRGDGDVDAIDPNDVAQQALGDCHLLGPAVAMIQSPRGRARMREMIEEVHRDGRTSYAVTFRIPRDRSFFERLEGRSPYDEVKVTVGSEFIKGHVATGDNDAAKVEVWPLVLEAAYAKLRGGYNKINGGVGTVGLATVTGKPAHEKTLEKGLFNYSASNLRRDAAAGKPICVTFTRQSAVPAYAAYSHHCYALASIFEKDGMTWAQLRNPWGKEDPKPIPLAALEGLRPQISVGEVP